MIRLPAALRGENIDADMLLQVHDELIFEVPEDQTDKAVAAITRIMEEAAAPVRLKGRL